MTEPPKYLIVTESMFLEGYWEHNGFLAFHRRFSEVKRDSKSGHITVINPEWELWRRDNQARRS